MPDDVRFKWLEIELVKDAVRGWAGGKGRPGGVEAADLRSSACFLPPPSMLKGRNQPEGAGDAALLADADPVVVAPAVSQTQCQANYIMTSRLFPPCKIITILRCCFKPDMLQF